MLKSGEFDGWKPVHEAEGGGFSIHSRPLNALAVPILPAKLYSRSYHTFLPELIKYQNRAIINNTGFTCVIVNIQRGL